MKLAVLDRGIIALHVLTIIVSICITRLFCGTFLFLLAPLAVNLVAYLLVLKFRWPEGIVWLSFLSWAGVGALYVAAVNLLVHAGDETSLARAFYLIPMPLGLTVVNVIAIFLWRHFLVARKTI